MDTKFRIGNVELDNNILVGPMAGISNLSYREMIREFNPGLIYSEMISDKAIVYRNKNTVRMTEVSPRERPVALQLFGHEMESMVQAAIFLDQETDCDIIDINMGCPVPKVVNSGAGSAMMKHPEETAETVKAIVAAVRKPVTVKVRAGWDSESINVVPFSRLLASTGISAICVHPRTRSQYYSGKADWDLIRQVKETVTNIPVIGNGDIKSVDDMIAMSELTHCDGFMVARGALGNPWLISQLVHYRKTGEKLPDPGCEEKIRQCIQHAERLTALKGEATGIKEMRGHACWYINGMPNNNMIRAIINHVTTLNEMSALMNDYLWALCHNDYRKFFEKEWKYGEEDS